MSLLDMLFGSRNVDKIIERQNDGEWITTVSIDRVHDLPLHLSSEDRIVLGCPPECGKDMREENERLKSELAALRRELRETLDARNHAQSELALRNRAKADRKENQDETSL